MKIKTKTVHTVNYGDLEDEIKKVYGREFSIPADLESSNDTSKEISVDGKLGKYEQADLDKWKETGEGGFLTRAIMNDMCANGHIPAGDYVIRISW